MPPYPNNSQKKLLVLLPNLKMGGAERVVITLLGHFDPGRLDTTLLIVDNPSTSLGNLIPEHVCTIALNQSRVIKALPSILRLVWRERPDVLFTNLSHLNLAVALIRRFFPTHTRVIARESSIVSMNIRGYRFLWLWRTLYRFAYRQLDRIICQSNDMQHDLMSNFGVPEAETVVIPNPIDIAQVVKLSKQKVNRVDGHSSSIRFVAVGGLRPEKRFDRLLQALAILRSVDYRVDIVGEGNEAEKLQGLCSSLGLEGRVCFRGFQDNPYVWMKDADALLLSSDYEGAPNAVLEALVLGTPVIATPAPGGLNEMLKGQTACIVAKELSANGLAEAILEWIDLPEKQVLSAPLEKYDSKTIAERYESVLLCQK